MSQDYKNIFIGEKAACYKCIICGQTYDTEISLYAHITSHSQEIMFSTKPWDFSSENQKLIETQEMNPNKENRSPGECWNPLWANENDPKHFGCRVKYNGKLYECELCSKKYKGKRGVLWHMKTVHESVDFEFKCEICEKVCPLHEELEHHFRVAHSESVKIECEVCGKNVKKIRMKSHMKSHDLKDIRCSVCHVLFQSKADLKIHLSEHIKDNPYECDTCKECFSNKKVLLGHLVKTHLNESQEKDLKVQLEEKEKKSVKKVKRKRTKLDKPFKCDVENCRYATSQTYLLKAHKFKHNPFYKCVTCQEKLPSRQELKSHMTTHGERPYKCDQCNKSYKDKHGLGWHKKVQHDPSRLKFTCELCGKTYPFDSLLTQHINLTHATEKQSVCDICGKNVSKTYLPMHRRTHGEKQYSCDVCQKTFLEKAYLKRHKMIHTGEKPYVCNVCGNLFRQHSTLTIHMRTHTGDRPYKCVLCENAYKTHHNLKKHYRRSGHKIV